jgi:histidinol-phosphatase
VGRSGGSRRRYDGIVSDLSYGSDWSARLRRADPAELADWLEFAQACCDLADEISLASFRTKLEIQAKADGSFVTEADRSIEQLVRARIAERYPEHGVVGEEYGTAVGGGGTRWFLDPIDGTHNFMRGVPLFGILLAVECDGEIQAGVVSAPALGRRWYASRGGGAWVLGGPDATPRRLRVTDESAIGRSQLLYRSVTDMHASRVSAGFDALLPMVWRERGFGDFWGYTLVADGAAEAMVEQDLGPWDLAAPWIVVEEAGGRITDFDGSRSTARGEAIATNGVLHDAFLDRLWQREADPRQPAAR